MHIDSSRLKAARSWLAMAVICVALAISLRPHTPERVIRLTGLILQLFGIGTVIWGISETRAAFGHPSFASMTKAWLSRLLLLRRDARAIAGGATGNAIVGNVRAYGTHGPGANPTIAARLDALEKNITSIHERISQTQRDMSMEILKIADTVHIEEQSRQTEASAIREKLEATATGGVHISAIGASWLFVGVILSTAAIEIAKLLE